MCPVAPGYFASSVKLYQQLGNRRGQAMCFYGLAVGDRWGKPTPSPTSATSTTPPASRRTPGSLAAGPRHLDDLQHPDAAKVRAKPARTDQKLSDHPCWSAARMRHSCVICALALPALD